MEEENEERDEDDQENDKQLTQRLVSFYRGELEEIAMTGSEHCLHNVA